jgi:WLM domain
MPVDFSLSIIYHMRRTLICGHLIVQGLRHYTRIRMTLCHELAHMVWGEHDNNFKALNSQLLKEVEALDWTRGAYAQDMSTPGGEHTAVDAWVDPDDVMAVTAQSSGKTLRALSGAGHLATPPSDPRAAARWVRLLGFLKFAFSWFYVW